MRRHPALEPFSRDHNTGLILARRLSLAAEGGQESRAQAADLFLAAWNQELRDHFEEEERLLGPLAAEAERDRLQAEHETIREMVQGIQAADLTPTHLTELGVALHDHIRWEEREFFTSIEQNATEEQLQELEVHTHEVEQKRWPHSPKREELVRARKAARER